MKFDLMKEILTEVEKNLADKLNIKITSKYKKGLKKHSHDKRAMKAHNDLVNNYLVYNKTPPIEYNVHNLKNGNFKGYRSAHLVGQQILILYKIDDTGLELVGLGSHTEIGTM